MAIMKKKGSSVAVAKEKHVVVLPDEPSEPSDSLSDYSIMLYGGKKIGKTTLCSQFPDPFFLATEPGTKALRVRALPARSWEEAVAIVDALEKKFKSGTKYCGTVIVDTTDLLYEYAFSSVCRKKMIKHPHEENDFGATWREIRVAFRDIVVRLLSLPCGVVFVSHDTEKEIELADGNKVDRTQPTMSGQALAEIEGIVDIIAYYGFEGKRRSLRIRGHQSMVAGTRLKEHFIKKGGKVGKPEDRIIAIPLGDTEEEAYENLIRAFDNEQDTAALPQEIGIPGAKTGMKVRKLLKK
jgi:hypothetical protein